MTGPNGEIYEANEAFCSLVKYSEPDLQRMGTVVISVDSEDHDEIHTEEVLSQKLMVGEIQNYNIWKSYRDKYGTTIPGKIHVIRYPQGNAQLEYCLCWFTPLLNGSKAALDAVMRYLEKHSNSHKENSETIKRMAAAIQTVAPRTKFRAMADSVLDWMAENPKLAIAIVVMVFTFSPRGMIENWATKQGWLPAQPVQIQIRDEKTGQLKPADEMQIQKLETRYAQSIANVGRKEEDQVAEGGEALTVGFIEVTTKAGNHFSIPRPADRSVLRDPECDRRCSGPIRRSDYSSSEFVRRSGELPGGELRDRAVKEQ
jgi:PAS domain S-box-containing protein